MTTPSGMSPAARHARALLRNLAAGSRLALGLPQPRFEASAGQLFALLALGWLCALYGDWRDLDGAAVLSPLGLATAAAQAYWWLAVVALISLLDGVRGGFLRLALACAAADPLLWLCWFATLAAIERLPPGWVPQAHEFAWWTLFAWQVLVFARALWLERRRPRWRPAALAALYAAGLYASVEYVPDIELMVPRESPPGSPPLDVEGLYYAQADLLSAELAGLGPGRAGLPDFYFVGFGAYAAEGVFRREVGQVREIVGRRLDSTSRSVVLLNSRRTLAEHPLANRSNLDWVLRQIGRRMEPEHDILFLFLTSHGRASGELVVDFGPLGFNDLTPEHLRRMLDDAGIRWRVLVVSACFSGAFVPSLADPRTLVITAAARDRSSFGCAHENRWTYFGQAYFRDALAAGKSLSDAFELAKSAVSARESREGREASLPQMALGGDIARHLAHWESTR